MRYNREERQVAKQAYSLGGQELTTQEKLLDTRCRREVANMFRGAMWGDNDFEIIEIDCHHLETDDSIYWEAVVKIEQWEREFELTVGLDECNEVSIIVGEDMHLGRAPATLWMVLASELHMEMRGIKHD